MQDLGDAAVKEDREVETAVEMSGKGNMTTFFSIRTLRNCIGSVIRRKRRRKKAPASKPHIALVGIFVVLLSVFLNVMWDANFETAISKLLGITDTEQLGSKFQTLQFIGVGIGGTLLALQAAASHRRAKALEETVKHTESGQRQERLRNAIEHLGNPSESVRLGGAYELFHLAHDIEELRQTVLDILCTHIRTKTSEGKYRDRHRSQPSVEIQSLLCLVLCQDHEVFNELRIDLKQSWLKGAVLENARLSKAMLDEAHLQEAILEDAHLEEASLERARLQETWLNRVHLQGANLLLADLQGADLREAELQGADLRHTTLKGAILMNVCLQGAKLERAEMQGTLLMNVGLQATDLNGARLEGAGSEPGRLLRQLGEHLRGHKVFARVFERRINARIDEKTSLDSVTFEGGMTSSCVRKLTSGLSDQRARTLRKKLKPHLWRRPIYLLPKNSGAVRGAFTAEDAKRWIENYKKDVPDIEEENPPEN